MIIRPVSDADYPDVATLRSQTIQQVNSKDYPEEIIDRWSTSVSAGDLRATATAVKRWVAVEEKMIIGFCEHTNDCEISRIYVHHDHLRKGVGSQLLRTAEASLREQGCKEIRIESTTTAKDFYEKHGYEVLGKTAYKGNDQEPIFMMLKRLSFDA